MKTTYPNDSIHNSEEFKNDGLTKREYFAAMIMQGIVTPGIPKELYASFAKDAVQLADALIKELNKGGEL